MRKGTLVLLFSVVLFGGGVALAASLQGGTLRPVLPPGKPQLEEKGLAALSAAEEAELLPVVLEAEEERYEVEVAPGSTVYDLLTASQRETDFTFSGREFAGLGFFVEEINGKRQSGRERKYWIYYINGQKAQVGVSWHQLQPYDVISFKYEDEE